MSRSVLVVGAGAAGFFAAIAAKQASPETQVILVEAGKQPLRKVAISGGGRCNVTHQPFDVDKLSDYYPRGAKELKSVYCRFGASDTIKWFESHSVSLKVEADGRVFPTSNKSSSIIDCLKKKAYSLGVELCLNTKVAAIKRAENEFVVSVVINGQQKLRSVDIVIITTGSAKSGYELASSLGHTITKLVPSLFSFRINAWRLKDFSGISVQDTKVSLDVSGAKRIVERGPLLITHWGISGPAVIRLSAWGALPLAKESYCATVLVDWIPTLDEDRIMELISKERRLNPTTKVINAYPIDLPKRLWRSLALCSGVDAARWADLSKAQVRQLVRELKQSKFEVTGKGDFKEEFVTAGGVKLSEINFKTMQSKLCPGLYFAGEVLDIDGITGGFNFQSAWSTGWIAGASASAGTVS